jgi:acyl-coenzyme A thioesterase PaaI-like protein
MSETSETAEEIQTPYGQAFADYDLRAMMYHSGHGALLKQQFHALGDDWVELALPWNAAIAINAETGVLASGPVISLLDNATGMAAWQKRGMILHQVTVDLRLDYLRAPTPGRMLIGRGECYGLAGELSFVRGIAYEDSLDEPVARATGTYMLIGEPA